MNITFDVQQTILRQAQLNSQNQSDATIQGKSIKLKFMPKEVEKRCNLDNVDDMGMDVRPKIIIFCINSSKPGQRPSS